MAESSDEPKRETEDADGASDPATRDGDESVEAASDAEAAAADRAASADEDPADADLEALREEVDDKYDFDNFSPSDMADMSAREWEAAFDPETWITGDELLARVEKDLRSRIARREVFAVLERAEDPDRVVAYSDEGWAIVYPDGSVEGEGTVLRDVKPTIALCSMDSYEVADPPEAYELPSPEEVQAGTGEFGNNVMQLIAAAQVLAGLGILGIWLFTGLIPSPENTTNLLVPVLAVFFLGVGLLLLFVVANARLSDRFRAEEYRDRLRAAGITDGESGITDEDRPEFLPFEEVVETTLDGDGLPAEATDEEPDDEPATDGESDADGADDPDDPAGESWA
ncbi:hypothetical protein [Halobaculum sp. MBLA0143]|uniref:DUF7319 domain-containing protein n=1 Tax=Halobaculum sp. MBLA0143 TaxID=3079933 RepID=UPI003525836E